ncbi:poly-gamma-glutamate hydrolase family protein [Actinoplanes sp. NPDC051861]|uniref:poly-gamma-glutamate hydrolase family protein n=1 Tax=Actinoplanes sp. NPDC051861 TaxID=3155170 RepID=UPI00344746F4
MADVYGSNSELYTDPALAEGVDYARRFRRHAVFDDSEAGGVAYPDTVVVALHGGGIEPGTSELCLAIAGYHPAGGESGGAVLDYWIFEGIRAVGNAVLHVTSVHCDDPVAVATVAGSRRTVSLHGCTPEQARVAGTGNEAAVLVGGRDAGLKAGLLAAYCAAGFQAIDADRVPELNGDEPENITNRNLSGAGVQLELTTPLRESMFEVNTRSGRKDSTRQSFWDFVGATRAVL